MLNIGVPDSRVYCLTDSKYPKRSSSSMYCALDQRIENITADLNRSREVKLSCAKVQIEYYRNCPPSEMTLPAIPHHWLMVQIHDGPEQMLIQHGKQESCLGGKLHRNNLVYIAPFTETEWEFTGARGCIHILIPDSFLLDTTASEKVENLYLGDSQMGMLLPELCQHVLQLEAALQYGDKLPDLALYDYLEIAATLLVRGLDVSDRKLPKSPSRGLSESTMSRIQEYVWSRVHKPIQIEELASLAGMSPGYFSRCFKAVTHSSPHRYITRMRVSKARELLHTPSGISEVAYLCGFYDQAHLSRVFKQWTGLTPSDYKRMI